MKKPRIYSVDYFDFMNTLRKASNTGHRIEKTEKQRWEEYVRNNKVPEAAMSKHAESMVVGGRIDYVIINDNGEWEGYYIYSKDDLFCIKYDVRGE